MLSRRNSCPANQVGILFFNDLKQYFTLILIIESRDRLQEEGRIVEGGNDRVPSPNVRSSKLPQEIHNKFSGKSREVNISNKAATSLSISIFYFQDLLEKILNLESTLEKQTKHAQDLEDYIDNLLLRVMDHNPSILQAPLKKFHMK